MTPQASSRSEHTQKQSAFPRSGRRGPNLATLDQLRGLRRPRLRAPEARRHQVPRECAAC